MTIVEKTSTAGKKAERTAIEGRVDAVENGRVFGWAWLRDRAEKRIEVRVLLGDRVIATAAADKQRIDLKRNGIGDGSHAFDIVLPEASSSVESSLTVVAVHPEGGPDVALRIPSNAERAAEAAVSGPLAAILQRADLMIAAQRQIQVGFIEYQANLRQIAEQTEALARAEARDAAGLGDGYRELSARLTELETFLVRFDASLGGFDRRLEALSKQSSSSGRPQLLLLALIVGVIAGVAIAAGLSL